MQNAVRRAAKRAKAGSAINTNNHYHLAPFCSPDGGRTLEILDETFEQWSRMDALDLLKPQFHTIVSVRTLSQPISAGGKAPDWFWRIYDAMLSRANASRWARCIPHAAIIELSPEQCVQLHTENSGGGAPGQKPLTEWLTVQIQALIDARGPLPSGYFVKCGTCSTKHEYLPQAVFSGREAVDHLLCATPVLKALKLGTAQCIMLRPFVCEINTHNELRVFVRKGLVTGVSQQACYTVVDVIHLLDPTALVKACQKCYDKFSEQLEERHQFLDECTFDAYFLSGAADREGADREGADRESANREDADREDLQVFLIEINSGMFGWGPAGSSLFEWVSDPPPQAHEQPVFYYKST